MFDIGWTELLVIGIVALIVVGPKDLPMMFRKLGQFTGQARRMAREFTSAMEEAADEAGVKEMQKDLRAMANPKQMGLDALKDAADLGDFTGGDSKPAKPKASANAGPATQKLAAERAKAAEAAKPDAASTETGTEDSAP
ncbi:MAG: Sec-independent protein translocase protein TatB [Mangrovicoccus sp.]|nr:Sec-independent protein translocase protein TatB [Mangrovicoccus sp.]